MNEVQQLIGKLWLWLEQHLPLANTHGGEFISSSHWDHFVPPCSQRELLAMTIDQLVNLPLQKDSLEDMVSDSLCMQEKKEKAEKGGSQNEKWLLDFLRSARQFHLDQVPAHILDSRKSREPEIVDDVLGVVSEAMSQKKLHEVEILSNKVKSLFDACKADVVVDLGSGKGYLSTELSRRHCTPVLGMDSSDGNTHGALIRDAKLGKRWKGLSRRQQKCSKEKNQHTLGNQRTKSTNEALDISPVSEALQHPIESSPLGSAQCDFETARIKADNHEIGIQPSQDSAQNHRSLEDDLQTEADKANQSIQSLSLSSPTDAANPYVPVTMFVHPDIDLRSVLRHHAPQLCQGKDPSQVKVLLTGLHTCGSLAVTSLQLFLQDPSVVALCGVGCCYQLMDEGPLSKGPDSSDAVSHFPLSSHGKSLGLHLGRNARNLASQSVHRIQESKQLQGGDFYWRALLDVLLQDLNLEIPERIMGLRGLKKRSSTFQDYVIGAFKKMGLDQNLVTEKKVRAIEEKFRPCRHQMACFFQLKLTLAPVIEALILLDRFLFLLEQDFVRTASLVQLFDPKTSPRCYALIATKVQ